MEVDHDSGLGACRTRIVQYSHFEVYQADVLQCRVVRQQGLEQRLADSIDWTCPRSQMNENVGSVVLVLSHPSSTINIAVEHSVQMLTVALSAL